MFVLLATHNNKTGLVFLLYFPPQASPTHAGPTCTSLRASDSQVTVVQCHDTRSCGWHGACTSNPSRGNGRSPGCSYILSVYNNTKSFTMTHLTPCATLCGYLWRSGTHGKPLPRADEKPEQRADTHPNLVPKCPPQCKPLGPGMHDIVQ